MAGQSVLSDTKTYFEMIIFEKITQNLRNKLRNNNLLRITFRKNVIFETQFLGPWLAARSV